MPKYVDENGVRRIWQTAENTFLNADEAEATYLRSADAERAYLRADAAENTYIKAADARNEFLNKNDAANTYLTPADAEDAYLKQNDAEAAYLKIQDAANTYIRPDEVEDTYLKKEDADDTYMKKADAGAISEENYTTAEKEKLAGLNNYELPTASDQQLGGIKIGEGLEVDANGVVSVAVQDQDVNWEDVNNSPTTLAGYGITDAATKADIEEIESHMAGFYVYRGKVATMTDLANIQNPKNGDTYDVEDSGVNYAWNEAEHRWDSMGGLGNIMSLSDHEIDILMHIAPTRDVLLYLLSEGGKTTLDADITVTSQITLTENTELDLANCTLTSLFGGYMFIVDGATLTLRCGNVSANGFIAKAINGGRIIVESGNYISNGAAFESAGQDTSVTISGGTITCGNGALISSDGGMISIQGGTVISSNGATIATSTTDGAVTNQISITGGNIIARTSMDGYISCGVCLENKDQFVMSSGRITSTNGCGLLIRDGRAVIRNGTIAAEGSGTGWIGSNGTRMSHSAIIYHETAKDTHYGMRLEITNGLFEGANLALEIISENEHPNILINGGTFVPSI